MAEQDIRNLQEFLRVSHCTPTDAVINLASVLANEIRAWESAPSAMGPRNPTFKRGSEHHLDDLHAARRALRAAVAYLDARRECEGSCRQADIQVVVRLE